MNKTLAATVLAVFTGAAAADPCDTAFAAYKELPENSALPDMTTIIVEHDSGIRNIINPETIKDSEEIARQICKDNYVPGESQVFLETTPPPETPPELNF